MLLALSTLLLLAASLGYWLGRPFTSASPGPSALIERINHLLPQTQCGQCSYDGCKPYASAIVAGSADINQCPPGGDRGVLKLARLLDREPKPLNPENGVAKMAKTVAVIDEAICIGCTKCILACPVDAILGAAQQMHTVLAAECTGCELCIAPCPVDCIDMVPAPLPAPAVAPPTSHPIDTAEAMPCIRCGDCAEACPPGLLPQLLYRYASSDEYEQAAGLDLFDCIECGRCEQVCPSELPLLQTYRAAKHELRTQREEQQQADAARARYEAREIRLLRDQHDKTLMRTQKKAQLATQQTAAAATTQAATPAAGDDPVARALAAAKARKAAAQSQPDSGKPSA